MSDKTGVNLKRFKKLIDNSGVSRQVIADFIGCDVSTITKHYNNDRKITIDYVIKYAEYFKVSTDYLLGLSDVPTTDKDLQFICDYTGLNEKAIEKYFNPQRKQWRLGLDGIINLICDKFEGEIELSAIISYINEFKKSNTELFQILMTIDNCENEQHLYTIAEAKIREKDLAQFRAEREFRNMFRLLIEEEERKINDTFSTYTIKDEFDITD